MKEKFHRISPPLNAVDLAIFADKATPAARNDGIISECI